MKINVLDVNNVQKKGFNLHRENGTHDYLFVLFKSPSKVLIDGKYVNADNGSFIVFDKGKVQSYYCNNDVEFLHDFMHFDLDNDYEKELFNGIPKGKLITVSLPNAISVILSEIKSEVISGNEKYKTDILTHLGRVFLLRLTSAVSNAKVAYKNKVYFKVLYDLRREIYDSPQFKWHISVACKKVGLSRSYFQNLYKKFFSTSFNEDVINSRITLAKTLLFSETLTVNEVSYKCGYSNVEHFIRQFKLRTGVSPKKFNKIDK